jgi:hypothetical protein
MTDHVDLDDLRKRTFFESATLDPRFVFEETDPLTDGETTWRQFKLIDCAHRDVDREGDVCGHCGKDFTPAPVKAPVKKTAARRRRK